MNKVLSVLCICLCLQLSAQIPAHKTHRTKEAYQGKTIELGPLQIAETRTNQSEKNLGAIEFAERRDVNLTPFNSGEWRTFKQYKEWTLTIQSKSAKSLNLGFTEYQLPDQATMSIITEDGETLGPFTKSDNEEHLQFWTPIVLGDKLTIQLRIPEDKISELSLRLSAVNHGFRFAETRSGSCNIDVLCADDTSYPLIEKYKDQIQSVGVVQINGVLLCTGYLVNNGNNDFTPYFITAAHCRITERNASTVVVYWNFQNSFCRTPNSAISGQTGDGTQTQFSSGAELVSSAEDGRDNALSVDFTLIRLNDRVDPNFSPYFAGWDISSNFSDTSFVVHHPNAEEKRISFDYGKPRLAPMIQDSFTFNNQPVEDSVFVRVENWEQGTTEFGSSGAPLFDVTGKVIGSLSGGRASCVALDGFDDFGWLGLAWENEGTPETRLKDWLDPQDAGITSLNGLNGSFTLLADEPFRQLCGVQSDSIKIDITVDDNFENTVDLTLINLPNNASGSFINASPSPGETTTLVLSNLSTLPSGMYQVGYEGTDGVNQSQNLITLNIISNAPTQLISEFPKFGETVNNLAVFEWSGNAELYSFEIAEDISFSNPIISDNSIDRLSYSTSSLPLNSEFFWRVRGENFCGNSLWTEPILFRTTSLDCSQFDETDLNIQISDARF